MASIHHRTITAQAAREAVCDDCGTPLMVDFAHVGGHNKYQPVLCCPKACNGNYYRIRLTEPEYRAYLAWIRELTDRQAEA